MGFKRRVAKKEHMPERAALSLTFPTAEMLLGPGVFSEPGGKKHLKTHTLTSLLKEGMTTSVSRISLLELSGLFPSYGGISLFPHVGMSPPKQANKQQLDKGFICFLPLCIQRDGQELESGS